MQLYLLLGLAAFMFLRTLYYELNVDAELSRGGLPAALSLLAKLRPAAHSVAHRTYHAALELAGQPEAGPSAAEGASSSIPTRAAAEMEASSGGGSSGSRRDALAAPGLGRAGGDRGAVGSGLEGSELRQRKGEAGASGRVGDKGAFGREGDRGWGRDPAGTIGSEVQLASQGSGVAARQQAQQVPRPSSAQRAASGAGTGDPRAGAAVRSSTGSHAGLVSRRPVGAPGSAGGGGSGSRIPPAWPHEKGR